MRIDGLLMPALVRIIPASLVVGAVAAMAGYWHAQTTAEQGDLRMLSTEIQRAVPSDILAADSQELSRSLDKALDVMVGGMFAIVEAYSPHGKKIGAAVQPGFEPFEAQLATLTHAAPDRAGSYDISTLLGQPVIRVFTPLIARDGKVIGHIEGVRVVSDEELSAFRRSALESAAIAAGAVLLCALVLSPLLARLAVKSRRTAVSLLETHVGILEAFGRAAAQRDSDTGTHNYRVSWIAARLAEEINLPATQLRCLIAGAFLHDIGKIGIPDAILQKPGKLTEREIMIMQGHVEIGANITGCIGFLGSARDVVIAHHEKWDGSGYPKKLAGESIPIGARIFCIADVFDALRATRPYKASFSFEESMQIMREGRGKHFDPALFDVFEGIARVVDATVNKATDAEVTELVHQMVRKHFFSNVDDALEDVYCTTEAAEAAAACSYHLSAAPPVAAGGWPRA